MKDEACKNCEAGNYQAAAGQLTCDPCGDGEISAAGATTCTQCDEVVSHIFLIRHMLLFVYVRYLVDR